MEMIGNGHIKNWTPVIGQTCQAWNRLRPREYGIEVTPVCPGTGRNFDNRVQRWNIFYHCTFGKWKQCDQKGCKIAITQHEAV